MLALLHNAKNGTFKDVTEPAGLNDSRSMSGLTFIDYDHDGDLDLFASSRFGGQTGAASGGNALWRNNGNSTFTVVTEDTGLTGSSAAMSAMGTDYNNDRAVDHGAH